MTKQVEWAQAMDDKGAAMRITQLEAKLARCNRSHDMHAIAVRVMAVQLSDAQQEIAKLREQLVIAGGPTWQSMTITAEEVDESPSSAGSQEPPSIERRVIDWLLGEDCGASSQAIVINMLGASGPWAGAWPHDDSDCDRCIKLLELIPEWIDRLGGMETAKWSPWIERIRKHFAEKPAEARS